MSDRQETIADTQQKYDWSVKNALALANTFANHGWTHEANADAASSCIYALCRLLKDGGNAAAMREALVKIHDLTNALDENCGVDPVEIRDIARNALTKPPRNCDVGTAEEQERRFRKYCETEECNRYRCGHGCKAVCIDRCAVTWSQMPYEAKEGVER